MSSIYMLFVSVALCYASAHSFISEPPPESWIVSSLLWSFRALLLLAAVLTLRDALRIGSTG